MTWVVKHKDKDRYLTDGRTRQSSHVMESLDSDELVPSMYAKVYPTLAGAKSALKSYASYYHGGWQVDKARFDSMEIVPINQVILKGTTP